MRRKSFLPQQNSIGANLQKLVQMNEGNQEDKQCLNSHKSFQKTHVYFLISNFYLVRKFVGILKYLTSKRSPKYLSQYHFQLINDKGFCYEEHCKHMNVHRQSMYISAKVAKTPFTIKFLTYMNSVLSILDNKIPIFDLNNTYILLWNLVVVISLLFFFIYIPMFVAFGDAVLNVEGFQCCKYFGIIILFLDVFKCLNTSFYKQGSLIAERREILLNYMRNSLLVDIFSLVPIVVTDIAEFVIFKDEGQNYFTFFTFLFFLKMSHFQDILSKFEEMIFIDKMFRNTLSLIKLIFRILLISHIFACFWYMIGRDQFHTFSDTWITKYGLEDQAPSIQYLYSFYYVCITMNTVGYGDITPQNPMEVLFSTVFIYLACGMFAYSLNSIGIIVNDLTKRQNEFSKEMNLINSFMQEKNVNFDLRMRVRKYLEYIFHEKKIENFEEQGQIINKLSENLKEELLIEANGIILRDIKLLAFNFSEETLRKTVSIMKEVRFTPGDLIFSAIEGHDKDLFIIRNGAIEIFLENENNSNDTTVIRKLKPGDFFGEKSFFANHDRTFSARSLDFTTVCIIKQDEFLNILRKNPRDYERFCEIRDRINVHHDHSFLFQKCFSCMQNTHLIELCPILHYSPINDIVIQKFLYTPPQERKEGFSRQKLKRFNPLKDIKSIQSRCIIIQEELYHKVETEEEEEEDNEDEKDTSNTNLNSNFNMSLNSKNEPPFLKKRELSIIKDEEDPKPEIKIATIDNENDESSNSLNEFCPNQYRSILHSPKHKKTRKTRSKTTIAVENNDKSFESPTHKESSYTKKDTFDEDGLFRQISIGKSEKTDELLMPSIKNSSPKLRESTRASIMGLLTKMVEHVKLGKSNESFSFINSFAEVDTSTRTNGEAAIVPYYHKETLADIDMMKSFEEYFAGGNVENVLEKVEHERMKRVFKKLRKTKSIYSRMSVANKELMESGSIRERSKFFENAAGVKKPRQNIMRKNFFKNSKNLEKMIKEELFNPEKLKDYYIKKYQHKKRKGIWENIMNLWRKVWKKPARKHLKLNLVQK